MLVIAYILAVFVANGPAAAQSWNEHALSELFLCDLFSRRLQHRNHDLSNPRRP
jgi:hypothetical protein